MSKPEVSLFARTFTSLLGVFASALLVSCSDASEPPNAELAEGETTSLTQALNVDALAEAYALFKSEFVDRLHFDAAYRIGYGFSPALVTERLVTNGHSPKGQATLHFAEGRVQATLEDAPSSGSFDLWFVKNIAGSGRTIKPETGDQFFKVGTFTGTTEFGGRSLDVVIGSNVNFDLDAIVVTRAGQHPSSSRIAIGARTVLEKRFFRQRAGKSLDAVTGTLANNVETTDPLVRRGAHLFFNEQFAGNGRTCGTCHRAENNLTIDPQFIATLPANDPLFVAEFNPALAALENPALLRSRALIKENTDGFDKPGVMRSVQHTLAMSATLGLQQATLPHPQAPADHRTGWGGDGAPGRGTLNEFTLGAIVQHFPKNLQRRPGVDFRLPTQEEADAIEAFQLFSGRQKLVDGRVLNLREARAEQGRTLFLSTLSGGKCANCHLDMGSVDGNPPNTVNFVAATGVRGLTPELPLDDGFSAPHPALEVLLGDGSFNVPPLIEAADTGAAFHNNGAADIEAAVSFYASDTFRSTPVGAGTDININATEIAAIGAFLRVMNAAENIRQVRKRVEFVRNNRSSGNTSLLDVAIADTQDALDVLTPKNLNPSARHALATVKQTLIIAKANTDQDRPAFMDNALVYLGLAKADLFTANPNNEF